MGKIILMDLEDLEQITGGFDISGKKQIGTFIVTNAAGANIRKKPSHTSKQIGHYKKGKILTNVSLNTVKGVKGDPYKWRSVGAQGNKPAGYIASHLLAKVK